MTRDELSKLEAESTQKALYQRLCGGSVITYTGNYAAFYIEIYRDKTYAVFDKEWKKLSVRVLPGWIGPLDLREDEVRA